MSRPPRIEFEGALYHVMTRGDRREAIFLEDQDRLKFLEYLEEGTDRYGVLVHCYVLMGNHFHLMVTTPKANLSKWMHQLKTAYTVYFNRRHGMVGHLFEGRFKSVVVEAESYLLELSRYLHLNPVRGERLGGGTPEERRERLRSYQWSSYRGYAGLGKSKRFVRNEAIERAFKTYAGQEWKPILYRRWVEEGLIKELDDPFEALKWQQVLGREDFLQQIKDRWNRREKKPRVYGQKRTWSAELDAKEILKTVGEYFGSKPAGILERSNRNSAARRCAMALCWDLSGMSHREISEMFGTPSSNAVAQMIRRSKEKENRTLKILRGKLSHK
jgi:putative transposase